MVQTPGKVHQSPNSVRVVDRTATLGRYIWRKSGVNRNSQKVYDINKKFKGVMGGSNGCVVKASQQAYAEKSGWAGFIKALRDCAQAGLGPGVSKSREYRMQRNKYSKPSGVIPTVATPAGTA